MLTFKTQFPINESKSVDDLFEAGRIWLAGSPHSSLASVMKNATDIRDEWSRESDNEKIRFIKHHNGEEASGFRHENLDLDGMRWVTEVACAKRANNFWISVQLSVDSELPVERIDNGKRPYILKTIMREIGGGKDGYLTVCDKPIHLTEEQVDLAADIITANAGCFMPVVYVSADSDGNSHINTAQLAQWLSGMAHVLVEPNRRFSFQLAPLVYRENAYGGAVAIYWPDGIGKWLFLPQGEFSDPKSLQNAIAKKVRASLLSQRTKRECTWSYILEQKSRKRIQELRDSGSHEVDEYISLFDTELESKNEEIQRLEAEVSRLKYSHFNQNEGGGTKGKDLNIRTSEGDLYQGERLSLIVEALEKELNSSEPHSRRYHVLRDLIDSNNLPGEKETILDSLKELLRRYRDMDSTTRSELERLGFSINDDGKHYKLFFRDEMRCPFILAKTGSDHRGGLNSFSNIKKKLF
ncbi:hypothetical protein [Ectothiorhodospira mobilis]|uniref:hypothetical protein n=1 Tax=Ectothiorhodospira mobilis TaxID=195064 RepID=UPI0019079398|nr:hypothetical protein [Ectothiorhodospira mobilis]